MAATFLASEIAKKIHRHPYTVSRWERNGWIRATRKNERVILFDLEEVMEDMAARKLKPGKPKA